MLLVAGRFCHRVRGDVVGRRVVLDRDGTRTRGVTSGIAWYWVRRGDYDYWFADVVVVVSDGVGAG